MKISVRLDRLFPAGLNWHSEAGGLAVALGAALLYGYCTFSQRFHNSLEGLYFSRSGNTWTRVRELVEGTVVSPFPPLFQGALAGFAAAALCMPALALFHYLSHYQGSRSIYLMRRLPRQGELWRRCLGGPALGLLLCALGAALTFALCFVSYRFLTPEGHLPPDLWAGIGGIV